MESREWKSQDTMSHGMKDTCGNIYCAMYNFYSTTYSRKLKKKIDIKKIAEEQYKGNT